MTNFDVISVQGVKVSVSNEYTGVVHVHNELVHMYVCMACKVMYCRSLVYTPQDTQLGYV